mgnify:CR=1 FL=1
MTILKRIISLWKIIILFFFVQSLATGCEQAATGSEQNIIDYYKTLPDSFFTDVDLGDIKYSLLKRRDKWISKSIADYEFEVIVDIKNGFIEINDEGTGGGNILIQVVLFRKADRSPIIGITMGGFNGIYFEKATTFYKKNKHTWVEAEDVFPDIRIGRFLNKNYAQSFLEKDDIIIPNLTTLTELPQFGTEVNLVLNFSKYDFLVEANHNPYALQPFSETEQDKLWEIINNIYIESFQLKMNKSTGRFEVIDSVLLNPAEKSQLSIDSDSDTGSDEAFILDKIWKLDVVNKLATYIDTESHQERALKLIFDGEIEDKPNYFLVRGVEDNGGNLVTHLIFHVKKDGSEIYLYDVLEDNFKMIDQ